MTFRNSCDYCDYCEDCVGLAMMVLAMTLLENNLPEEDAFVGQAQMQQLQQLQQLRTRTVMNGRKFTAADRGTPE